MQNSLLLCSNSSKKMKKILLLLAVFGLLQSTNAQSQCVPNAKTAPGRGYIIPDSATGMAHGCAGLPYEETFYIKLFKDTVIPIAGFPITATVDSLIINLDPTTLGLPSYLTAVSNPAALPANPKNNFVHLKINRKTDSLACIKISGTIPAGTPVGANPLNIPFKVFAKLIGLDTSYVGTYNDYKIVIDPAGVGACALSINNINTNLSAVQVLPNPTADNMNIKLIATETEAVSIVLINAVGQVVSTKNVKLNNGVNYIPFQLNQLQSGLYMYQIRNAKNAVVGGKFTKQ
jgi:Secretion system C-terminal sorting domain